MISFVLFFQASQGGMKFKNWSVCSPVVESDCITVENSPYPSNVYVRLCIHSQNFSIAFIK